MLKSRCTHTLGEAHCKALIAPHQPRVGSAEEVRPRKDNRNDPAAQDRPWVLETKQLPFTTAALLQSGRGFRRQSVNNPIYERGSGWSSKEGLNSAWLRIQARSPVGNQLGGMGTAHLLLCEAGKGGGRQTPWTRASAAHMVCVTYTRYAFYQPDPCSRRTQAQWWPECSRQIADRKRERREQGKRMRMPIIRPSWDQPAVRLRLAPRARV